MITGIGATSYGAIILFANAKQVIDPGYSNISDRLDRVVNSTVNRGGRMIVVTCMWDVHEYNYRLFLKLLTTYL